LVSKYQETVNGTYGNFLSGCMVGDSHISIRHKNTATLRLQDNENVEYINWKLSKISKFINFTKKEISRGYKHESDYTYEFAKIKKDIENRNPMYFLNNYSDLGFAIWLMDDGCLDLNGGHRRYCLSIKRLKNNDKMLNMIKNKFVDLGFCCTYSLKNGSIWFSFGDTDHIAETICKYVPESMQYKLPIEYRGSYEDFVLHNNIKTAIDYVDIKEIRCASDRQMRKKRKFDIAIEGNHNYVVGGKYNGVVVHNSPEVTTGGEALGFYSTGRISVRGPESKKRRIVDDVVGEVIGHTSEFEVVKNKLAPPFRKASIKLIYGQGYDKYNEVLDIALSFGIIDKTGAWYKYNDENFAQGEDKAVLYFKENEKIYNEIRSKVLDQVGLTKLYE
jgi:recombination protein RecA